MPKIRSIHPEACESADLERLSDGAERTFWRLLTHTDDEGRGKDDPRLLAAKLYPLHEDKDAATLKAHLSELTDAGLVVRYMVGRKSYYWIPTFSDYQKPKYRSNSKLPPPPEDWGQHGTTPSPDRDQTLPTSPPDLPHGEGDGEGVGDGEGDGGGSAKAATKRKRAAKLPDDWQPNDQHREMADSRAVDLDLAAAKFRDHAQANGRTLKDWDAGFRNWLRNERPASRTRGQPAHAASDAPDDKRDDPDFWSG